MDYLSFHEWVRYKDPKEVIDHSSWQSCAFGKYMEACHGFDASAWPDNEESLLRFIAEEDNGGCNSVSEWLFTMDEYSYEEARFIEKLLSLRDALGVMHFLSANNYRELDDSLGYIKEFID
jgi:hypothetical protein